MKLYLTKIKSFRYPANKQLLALIKSMLKNQQRLIKEISVTFVDNKQIKEMNKRYLEKNRPTDVIAFNLEEPGTPITGDIYISVDQAKIQALDYHVTLENELVRLVAHGILHVLGHDHQIKRDRLRMTELEDEWINKYTEANKVD